MGLLFLGFVSFNYFFDGTFGAFYIVYIRGPLLLENLR